MSNIYQTNILLLKEEFMNTGCMPWTKTIPNIHLFFYPSTYMKTILTLLKLIPKALIVYKTK